MLVVLLCSRSILLIVLLHQFQWTYFFFNRVGTKGSRIRFYLVMTWQIRVQNCPVSLVLMTDVRVTVYVAHGNVCLQQIQPEEKSR